MTETPQAPLDVKLEKHDLRIQTAEVDLDEGQTMGVLAIAHNQRWDEFGIEQLGLLTWALFRYYVMRLPK